MLHSIQKLTGGKSKKPIEKEISQQVNESDLCRILLAYSILNKIFNSKENGKPGSEAQNMFGTKLGHFFRGYFGKRSAEDGFNGMKTSLLDISNDEVSF